MLARLVCSIHKHYIDRHRVWFDNAHFRTTCRRCHKELLRDSDGWRVCSKDDLHPELAPHPRHRKDEAT